MTIILNKTVNRNYAKGEKLPLLLYEGKFVRFTPKNDSWATDSHKLDRWSKDLLEEPLTTILVPKEFT